ncbi:MAG: hypothetical protein M3Z05_10145 [Gemmatimonadota bacterium]|nr:hypothetical protein [Gemmatimonadota bacterium]
MTSPEIEKVRDDVQRTRAQLSDTLAELSARLTSPINAAKKKLNIVEMARNNPWPALALAIGTGVALSATGSDERIAAAAVKAGQAGVEGARDAAKATAEYVAESARTAPSKAREVIGDAADSLATKGLIALIAALSRDDRAT